MAAVLQDYPEIKQTFNLVPSLIEQILDYTDNKATDVFLEATRKRASELTEADKIFILENFFLANWDTMIKPFPRYYQLLVKRGLRVSRSDLDRTIKYFTKNEFLDLQVLFNLSWIDPMFRNRDPFLSHLITKGKDYTEDEKDLLIEKQAAILREIIPTYKALSAKGQIEISTTPFYHPILPLLWDTDIARMPIPDVRLPKRKFSHPEDARSQIRMALAYFEQVFGFRPSGMWPSEGSVSEDVVKAILAEGIQWIATDEDILSRSLGEGLRDPSGRVLNPSALYSVYDFSGMSMIFRDHKVSDLLGFVYSGWDPRSAASDLIAKLDEIRGTLRTTEPHIVPIILDGENAWEYYKNDGHDFFRYLYEDLSRTERFKTTTVSDFLTTQKKRKNIEHLAAGSWIYGNFSIWIGHEEDNTSWDYLTETREYLETFQKTHPGKNLDSAWKSLYVAEGSDWNWWYGDDHSTDLAEEFDELYRLNLMKVYKETGGDIPPQLFIPVLRGDRAASSSVEIRGFINPNIDGIMTSYFEWRLGAYIDVGKSGGSMHITESLISRVYYGFNQDTLFIRVDPKGSFDHLFKGLALSVQVIKPFPYKISVPFKKGPKAMLLSKKDQDWVEVKEIRDAAFGDIFECAIPFQDIEAKVHDELNLFISLQRGDDEIERCPWRGYITITVPTPDFDAMMWY
ncbi:MAG: glycoside hydrolase [Thermodesulfovibrionales bacterium]